tara:strand:+ start:163 stop:474 length:312 start_codon:yes stop_codon:yes gene_type:complete
VLTRNGIGAGDVLVYGKSLRLDVVTVIKLLEASLPVELRTHLIVGHVKNEKRIDNEFSVTLENGRVKDNGKSIKGMDYQEVMSKTFQSRPPHSYTDKQHHQEV